MSECAETWASDRDGSGWLLWERLREGEHTACDDLKRWMGTRITGGSVRQRMAALFDVGKFRWACWLVVKYGTEEEKTACNSSLWGATRKGGIFYLAAGRGTCPEKAVYDRPEIRSAFYAFAERLGADLKAGRLGEYPPKVEEWPMRSERGTGISVGKARWGNHLAIDYNRSMSRVVVNESTWREMVRRGNAHFGIRGPEEPKKYELFSALGSPFAVSKYHGYLSIQQGERNKLLTSAGWLKMRARCDELMGTEFYRAKGQPEVEHEKDADGWTEIGCGGSSVQLQRVSSSGIRIKVKNLWNCEYGFLYADEWEQVKAF